MTTEAKTVTIKQLTERCELYHRYPNQSQSQGCFLELDCDQGTLRADWDGEIGNAVPFDVWHGRTLRFGIPALRAEAANDLMEEILPLAEQIVVGYSCEWDGSNNVGQFTEDSLAAREQIEAIIHEYEQSWWSDGASLVQVVDADDYFSNSPPLDLVTADTTDEELAVIAAKVRSESDVDIIDGLESVLESVRQELRNERDDDENERG